MGPEQAKAIQQMIWSKKTADEKVALMSMWSRTMQEVAEAGARSQFPQKSESEIKQIVLERLHGQ
jgi:hypothetical protein